jgi:DNA-binding LacI/PurR family transcriptional regulator
MAPYLVPALTTVSHMMVQMGRRAAELALEIAASPDGVQKRAGHRELLVPELVVRSSTAPPCAI